MAVRIRLTRTGKKNRPFHRIGVFESTRKRDGKAIENLGHYSPVEGDDKISIDVERLNYWVDHGATMSETVRSLLRRHGKLEQLREAEGRRQFDRAKKAKVKEEAAIKAAEEKPEEAEAAAEEKPEEAGGGGEEKPQE